MADDIDRSKWSPQDSEAERQAQELVSLATGEPTPPPPPPVPPSVTGHLFRRFMALVRVWLALHGRFGAALLVVFIMVVVVVAGVAMGWFGSGDDPSASVLAVPGAVSESETPGEPPPGELEAQGEDQSGAGGEEQQIAVGNDLPGLVAVAVGTYRLEEDSARDALAAVVEEFAAADGALVIAADGTVSGELTYRYADAMGQDLMADVIFDGTLAATDLTAADDGLTFTGILVVVLEVSPRGSGEDIPLPFQADTTFEVIGVVDLDLGMIGLTQVAEAGQEETPGVVVFRR